MQILRSKSLWALLLVVGMIRLASLSVYPLMDTTEARYGEVSRIMAETGDWIVPRIDYDIPFWGKPPLAFWASAASIKAFGNSEFFLRLPHFLAAIAVLLLIRRLGSSLGLDSSRANSAVVVNATTIGFLITAGTVMTDMFLCLAMTLAMTGFWRGWHGERRQVYLMYAGLGIGLLAKGPIIVVLSGLVLLPWIASQCGIRKMWGQILLRLEPAGGILLMLVIAVPWYYLMERNSPGFLQYFLVGEHIQRFLDSGWQGDLYGSGHAQVRGTIWIYWFMFAFPWSLLLLIVAFRKIFGERRFVIEDPGIYFLVLWMCGPLLLFTLAGNILPAYILPGLPAVGLLLIKSVRPEFIERGRLLLSVGPILFLVLVLNLASGLGDRHSDKSLLAADLDPQWSLYYLGERPYSAQYYSGGRARLIDSVPDEKSFYLVVEDGRSIEKFENFCTPRRRNEYSRLFFCRREGVS